MTSAGESRTAHQRRLSATPPNSGGVEVDGLCKRVADRLVLEEVSFAVPAGGVFALVGGSGAGKSMLLRILATLVMPDEGTATVAGRSVTADAAGVRQEVGFLPDRFGVYEGLTAEEMIEFYAGMHGVRRSLRRRAVADVLEVVGLAGRRADRVTELDPGEMRRLGMARALVHDPAVLVLDEPTTGLQPPGQAEVLELIGGLGRLGKTVIVSGRTAAPMDGVVSSVGLIDHGRMVVSGPWAEVGSAVEAQLHAMGHAEA